jgi:polysaccharide export outer membrane protein
MNKIWILTICCALAFVTGSAACAAQAETQSGAAASPASSTSLPAAAATSPANPAPASTTGGSAPQFQSRDPRYRITASDSFDLTFPLSPEYNQLGVTVQPDGYVTLFGVGEAKVQGQTMPELTETVRTAYSHLLHDPIISIVLKDFNKPYFIADGQVGHPGKYDLRADTTLTEAVAIAGGFTEDAKHSQVVLIRRVGGQYVSSQVFDVKKMQASGNLSEDPLVHPGDAVFVPKNAISKIKGFLPSYNVGGYIPIK